MRARGAVIQGGLAALGLVAAYGTWQREPERAPGEVVVVETTKNDLSKVRFEDGAKWVELEQRKEGGEASVWLHLSASESPKAPERQVRGNDGATKLWEKFAPLRATRALGTQPAEKLKELGLDQPKKKILVTARGQTRTLLVGTSPYGVSDPYVMDAHDKRVYVLGGGVLADLEAAGVRLVNRALHAFKPNEYDALTVAHAGKKRELVQVPGDSPFNAKLASKKSPAKPDDLAKNWHDKVWRLYVTEVLGKGETPERGEPEVLLRLDYAEKGKAKGFMELGRVKAPPPPAPAASTPAPPQPPADIYARTEHTSGWVKLPATADDLIKEAEKVVSAE